MPAHWLQALAHQLAVSKPARPMTDNRAAASSIKTGVNAVPAALFATFTVNDPGDAGDASAGNGVCATAGGVCTLRAAIQEANALGGTDTINFSVDGTINLTSALPDLSSNITIDNTAGPAALTVRRGSGGNYRIFNIVSGVTVTLDGLTITNGRSDEGGGIRNAGTLTIQDCTISGNNTVGARPLTGGGAGVFNAGTGSLNILRSAILNNTATGQAGNGGAGGGGGGGGLGGGLYNNGGSVTVTNATISGNRAIGGAGANAAGDCCVSGGGAGGGNGGSGGVWNGAAPLAGGFGGGGGGGANGQNGAAGGRFGGGGGGGINISGEFGGGAGGFSGGNGGLASSSTAGNGAGGGGGAAGGAVFQNGGTLLLTHVTIVSNSAAGGAGGSGNTFQRNGADGSGIAGGIYNETGTLTIRNSIIATNTAASSGDCGFNSTAIVTNGFNLSGTGGGCPSGGTSDQTTAASSIFTTVLGSLNYYGGLTPSYAPLPGSPLIDKGGAGTAEDQRGETRPFDTAGVGSAGGGNASDIGAVESVSFSNPAVTNTNYGGPGSLARAVVAATSGSTITIPVTGTITTYSGDLLIDRNLTINGPGAGSLTVSGNDSSRVFFVNTSAFSLSNLTVAHGMAAGGNGAGGGGGAAGLGGGMFVNTGTVTLTNVPFANNQAVGGNGGTSGCCGGGGGGGGIGSNGGASGSPGGQGGDGGDGGSFNTLGGNGGASGVNGADGGDGAGGGGAGSQASGGDGGFGGGGGGGG
ncbi:MAG TPA: choice-of-anchor Q domain-containing protein, partial [Blastocatellia bacterium]